jgi:hypothetical protein
VFEYEGAKMYQKVAVVVTMGIQVAPSSFLELLAKEILFIFYLIVFEFQLKQRINVQFKRPYLRVSVRPAFDWL